MEAAKSRSQQLQEQVEDLQEKVSLQEAGNHGDASLLSELEVSLDADLGLWKDEVSRSLSGVLLPSCFYANLIQCVNIYVRY